MRKVASSTRNVTGPMGKGDRSYEESDRRREERGRPHEESDRRCEESDRLHEERGRPHEESDRPNLGIAKAG
jgi:hypothetical protein